MTTKTKLTEPERVHALMRGYSLTPEHVAAALAWPIEKTEILLGLRVARSGPDFRPWIGPRRVDRLAAACLCAPPISATPDDFARAGESDEVQALVRFAAECSTREIGWRVGDRPPTSRWPELKTHRTERLRRMYRSIGQGFATFGRTGYRTMTNRDACGWEDLADEIEKSRADL